MINNICEKHIHCRTNRINYGTIGKLSVEEALQKHFVLIKEHLKSCYDSLLGRVYFKYRWRKLIFRSLDYLMRSNMTSWFLYCRDFILKVKLYLCIAFELLQRVFWIHNYTIVLNCSKGLHSILKDFLKKLSLTYILSNCMYIVLILQFWCFWLMEESWQSDFMSFIKGICIWSKILTWVRVKSYIMLLITKRFTNSRPISDVLSLIISL